MDFVSRLIFALVLLSCAPAFAAGEQWWESGPSLKQPSAEAACQADITISNVAGRSFDSVVGLTCYAKTSTGSKVVWRNMTTGSCATGLSVVNGSCQVKPICGSNQTYDTDSNSCTCQDLVYAGKFMVPGDEYTGCNGGCALVLRNGWYDKTNNVTWGDWGQSGISCTASDKTVITNTDPKVAAAKQCAAGTCPVTVNGQSVCVPCDKSKQTQSTSSSTSSSSTASGAASSTTTAESGSESSQTSCKDGSCTTTTTTTTVGPNGDKVDKTTTKTEPQSDYCTQNPKAPVCKGSESSWGGSCGSFSCDGDAVTCAIAQASWNSACAIDIDETDPKVTAGNAAMSGGDRPGDHPGNSPEQNAFTANIDQSNPFGSECPADIPLDVMGQSVSIPLSHACDSLKFMGQVAVAFAMCAAAFIVFGGIKG